ncbi:MAG: hypothetical protein CVU42_06910 [Chloroflexi bacterium HGW-Chloroflexi-4]|jgi:membrane protein implicated in regulation of membrane protease activity|nr:MAG: hypothetical protein CVU42_06910 [Chloroflexi bacterium HGW-Chloroflexi-4]
MMNQTKKNFWIDAVIFAALLITTLSGFLLWLGNSEKGLSSLGSTFSVWRTMHLYTAMIGFTGIVLHVVAHWKWLKALRGRRISEMPKKLRANRIVNRVMWFTYIASVIFGMFSWAMRLCGWIGFMPTLNRLHVGFGLAWLTLAIVHLTFHRKWIIFTLRNFMAIRKPDLEQYHQVKEKTTFTDN